MRRLEPVPATLRRAALAGLALYGATVGGCATRGSVQPPPPSIARCDFEMCRADAASLAKVTADAIGAPPERIAVTQAQQQFNGAVVIWRATASGRRYECKEGRDVATRAVHYVDCRPSKENGAMTAFP